VLRRVLLVWTALVASITLLAGPMASASAAPPVTEPEPVSTVPAGTAPQDTVNEFLPTERSIGECISAVPKPGCGSEARGGWHQYLVAIVMVAGLVFVGWRVVAGVRRGRREPAPG
jgi:amino acid transporter